MNADYTMKITPQKNISLWDCQKAKIEFVFKGDNGQTKIFSGTIKKEVD